MGRFSDMPPEYKPHWSTWSIKGTAFEDSQRRLAKLGLSDPWVRNDSWILHAKNKGKPSIFNLLLRGWKGGVAAFLVVVAAEHYFLPKMEHGDH